jgi:hypothetical protein
MGDLPDWIRELRVDVKDPQAADGITPAGLLAYLASHEWAKVSEILGGVAEFWRHPDQPLTHHSLVPLAENYEGFRQRILDLARQIAALEHRGLIGVLADLRTASEPVAATTVPGQVAIDAPAH